MLEFTRLKNNLKKSTEGFAGVRLALLCDYSSQHLHLALKGIGVDQKLSIDVYESDYGQIEQQVFDESSELYKFLPDFIVLSKSGHKLLDEFYGIQLHERGSFAQQKLTQLQALLCTLQKRLKTTVILTNFPELNDYVFGNYANNVVESFLYQVRKLNLLLMDEARGRKGLFIADVQTLLTQQGTLVAIDQRNLVKADMAWSISFLPILANSVIGLIRAAKGTAKKCLVLDLDNTLWGGVIGDDGLEGIELGDFGLGKAFSRLQKWIKELKQRGIIVCICSKNNEAVAKEVFEKHPDSVLRLEDISVFVANWNNKVDNLHYIRNTLNIGFDAMVFVDDNPFERNMVKEAIPELIVPDLPEDPAEYLPYLQSLNLFETVSFTTEDLERTELYRQEAQRVAFQQVYKNEEEYLEQLQMKAELHRLDSFTIPRAAQLSQRSNQFNLRTVRYTEADLAAMAASPIHFPFLLSLKDKFGDYGIVSFVMLTKMAQNCFFIENWMMSCRVLKRGVELFVLNKIVEVAKEQGCKYVVGEYLPTTKNSLVKDHFPKLGFTKRGEQWELEVSSYEDQKTMIHSTFK